MKAGDITIITVVENDPGLFEMMLESVLKFTEPAQEIYIVDNTNGLDNKTIERIQMAKSGMIRMQIFNNSPELLGGSNRHGSALNEVFKSVSTKYTAIIESDCVLLKNNWWDLGGKKMLAARKGKDLYHICFMVFETNLLKGIDFRAGKKGNRSNRPYKPKEDVGHTIKNYISEKDIRLMDFVDCKSGKGRYFDSSFQSDELWLDGDPIVAHFGRGSNIGGKAIRKGFSHPRDQLDAWKKIAEAIK